MAFSSSGLNIAVDTLAGGALRIASYETSDAEATVTASGYFTDCERYGLKVGTLLVVYGSESTAYVGRISAISAAGHGTLTQDPPGSFLVTGGLFPSNLADRLGDMPNLRRDFNVKCDGTDETAKIQAAIDKLESRGTFPYPLFVPPGQYLISKLRVKEGIQFFGLGMGSASSTANPSTFLTEFKYVGSGLGAGEAMVLVCGNALGDFVHYFGWDNIAISGDNAAPVGLELRSTKYAKIGNIFINRCTEKHFYENDLNDGVSAFTKIDNIVTDTGTNEACANAYGIYIGGRDGAQRGVTNFHIGTANPNYHDQYGIYLGDVDSSRFDKIKTTSKDGTSPTIEGLAFGGSSVGVRAARKITVGMMSGQVIAKGDSGPNIIQEINSETSCAKADAGAIFYYNVHDRTHGDHFGTFTYPMSRRLAIPARNFHGTSGSAASPDVTTLFSSDAKVGATAGWVVGGGAINTGLLATLPASQTASTLVVPITGLRVGDTITGFHLMGQIESAGNTATLDADLRKHTVSAGDPTDASVGAITQISVTADTAINSGNSTKSGLAEVIAANETFYVLLTGTTAAATDVAMMGIAVTVRGGAGIGDVSGSDWPALLFPPTGTTKATATFPDYEILNRGKITGVRLIHSHETASVSAAVNVTVGVSAKGLADGIAGGVTTKTATINVTDTANSLDVTNITFDTAYDDLFIDHVPYLHITRNGDDAADTLTEDWGVTVAELLYTCAGPDGDGGVDYTRWIPARRQF